MSTVITTNIQMNSYANILEVSSDGLTIKIGNKVMGEYGDFAVGDTILMHVSHGSDTNWHGRYGRFIVKKISNDYVSLDSSCLNVIQQAQLANRNTQIVKVPTFANLTIESNVTLSPPEYNGKTGGIFAVDVLNRFEIKGIINASFRGLHDGYPAPHHARTNGGGNPSYSGSSHQFLGGSSGRNYYNSTSGPNSVIGQKDLLIGKMFMGGGSLSSRNIRGGGIVYINAHTIVINRDQCIQCNGKGGFGNYSGSASGGSVLINAKSIENLVPLSNFAGSTGGGGGGETVNGSYIDIWGSDGTNLSGGRGATGTGSGGNGYGPNGGGGSRTNSAGYAATATQGGRGADYNGSYGWDAGAGGSSGGYIAIYTDSKSNLTGVTLQPSAFIGDFKSFSMMISLIKHNEETKTFKDDRWKTIQSDITTSDDFINLGISLPLLSRIDKDVMMQMQKEGDAFIKIIDLKTHEKIKSLKVNG